MSVQGTILVLDGVSTNRIMLKVQLTAAWYHVVQGEKLKGLGPLLRRTRPDLVLTSQSLPDGSASDVKKLMLADPMLRDVPVVAIAPHNDKAARLRALSDGLDDVLAYPFKDTLLLARIRSFLRMRADMQDLRIKDDPQTMGLAEPAAALISPPSVAQIGILTQSHSTSTLWQRALSTKTRHQLTCHTQSNLKGILSGQIPDAIVVELGNDTNGLNVLADLRSRSATRHTALTGVLPEEDGQLAAEALDMGADAVCMGDFCPRELSLRVDTLVARKSRDDQMRASLRKGLADSWIDPLTGLHNRRFAMSAMAQIVRQSVQAKQGFVLMLADLDHFKAINDQHGHSVGDLVLTETGKRIQDAIGETGFVARIGGEEFMIGIPAVTRQGAMRMAERICDCICENPFLLPGRTAQIEVTISIGLKVGEPPFPTVSEDMETVEDLMQSADKALYAAKKAGRNQVRMRQSAA